MAKFLDTAAVYHHLTEIFKEARERLLIISPYLRFSDRIKQLLEDKNRMKIDVRVVYGKSELQPTEITWLRTLEFVRTSFCDNLHAKCYLSESRAIITSMNLYTYSQVNNNEMGVLIDRVEDSELYRDTYDEAQRLVRLSEEVRLFVEKVAKDEDGAPPVAKTESQEGQKQGEKYEQLTTSRLARAMKLKTAELEEGLIRGGYLQRADEKLQLTDAGKAAGGEFRYSKKYGPYFLWPKDLQLP